MDQSLSTLLEQEHHEIDAGIEAFLQGLSHGETRLPELTRAVDALRRHIYLEEEFLFPPLRAAGMIPPVLKRSDLPLIDHVAPRLLGRWHLITDDRRTADRAEHDDPSAPCWSVRRVRVAGG